MYKLLIVDDEHWIRKGLREFIDWKSIGVEEVCDAGDGGDALDKIQQMEPDIVIADIRMPDINGLELCEILKERFPKIKVIIISGYKDFEYARKAIVLGVYDYILKPLDEKHVVGTVMKCIKDIEAEKKDAAEKEMISRQLLENMQLVKQKLICSVLWEDNQDENLIFARFMELGVDIYSSCYIVFGAEIDDLLKIRQNSDAHTFNSLLRKLEVAAEDWIKSVGKGFCTWTEGLALVGCIGIEETNGFKNIVESMTRLNKWFYDNTGYTLTLYVAKPCYRPSQWPEAAKQVEISKKRKFFLGKGQVICYESSIHEGHVYRHNMDIEKYVLNCVKLGEKTMLQGFIEDLKLEVLSSQSVLNGDDVKLIYQGLVEYVYRGICEDIGQEQQEFYLKMLNLTKMIREMETLEEIHHAVLEKLLAQTDRLIELKGCGKRKIVQQVMDYVNRLYNKKITLSTAAEYAYLSPSYLSKLFCEEVGENFTRYLMKVRIKKAKELLSDPRMRIYEIGERVGYNDVKYFVKIFKEIEGLTPANYRERCLQNTKILE